VDDEIALCSTELAHLGLMRVPSLDGSVNGGSIGSVASAASSSSAASSVFFADDDFAGTSGWGGGSGGGGDGRMRKRQRRHNSHMALGSNDFKGILQSLFQKDGAGPQAAENHAAAASTDAASGDELSASKADAGPED
jgi:hypothetical protein